MKSSYLFYIYLFVNILTVSSRPQAEQVPVPGPNGLQNGISTLTGLFSLFTQAFSVMRTFFPRFLQLYRLLSGAGSGAGAGGGGDDDGGDEVDDLRGSRITSFLPTLYG